MALYNSALTEQLGFWDSRNHSSNSPNRFLLFFFFFQITLYLAKRDFVDHVDSVEVVGVFCNSHNTLIRSFDYFKSNPPPLPPRSLSNPQRALSKSTPLVSKAEKVRVKKKTSATGTKHQAAAPQKSQNSFSPYLGSVRLPRLCLPLRKRWLGRHGPVLQERHLDPAHPGVPPHRRTPQVRDGGLPHEESRRAGTSLLLPGATATPTSLFSSLRFPLAVLSNVAGFPSVPQMPTDLPCSVSLQPGPGDAGKVPPLHIQTVTLLQMTVAQVL